MIFRNSPERIAAAKVLVQSTTVTTKENASGSEKIEGRILAQ